MFLDSEDALSLLLLACIHVRALLIVPQCTWQLKEAALCFRFGSFKHARRPCSCPLGTLLLPYTVRLADSSVCMLLLRTQSSIAKLQPASCLY